jgi:hypothetical protein
VLEKLSYLLRTESANRGGLAHEINREPPLQPSIRRREAAVARVPKVLAPACTRSVRGWSAMRGCSSAIRIVVAA